MTSNEKLLLFLFLGVCLVRLLCVSLLVRYFQVLVSISSKLPLLSVDKEKVFHQNKQGGKQSIMTQTDHINDLKLFANDTRNFNARKKYEILTFF